MNGHEAIDPAGSASMRPRVFPAEDGCVPVRCRSPLRGFNEAAGIPRGRRVVAGRPTPAARRASMRPRVFPAEDATHRNEPLCPVVRFNEAAGIPRGRRVQPPVDVNLPFSFNEAAGIPRGRHHRSINARGHGPALQ